MALSSESRLVLQTLLFYVFSLGLVAFAIGVVTARSAVYGVLSLVGAMCFMAGLFVLLKAFFVATVLVLVYAGAILVLFLFVVMLIDYRKITLSPLSFTMPRAAALALSVLLFAQFLFVIRTVETPAGKTALHGTAQSVGMLLFGQHVLAFELTSFLILAAVVSVVVLAKKEAE